MTFVIHAPKLVLAMNKSKQKHLPARADAHLIEVVNKHRAADDLSWKELIETLFLFYLKKGLPKIGNKPQKR